MAGVADAGSPDAAADAGTAAPTVVRAAMVMDFTEPVTPPAADDSSAPGDTVARFDDSMSVRAGGQDVPGQWLGYTRRSTVSASSTTDPRMSVVFVPDVEPAAGTVLTVVVHAGGVVDDWQQPIATTTITVTWGGSTTTGAAPGTTQGGVSTRSYVGNNLAWQGHLYDAEAGLVLARARVIEPIGGTFLQRDPEGYVDSVNVYAAMANDPINNRDPTGLSIGWIYLVKGTLNGQKVFYVGSTTDLESRFEGHKWRQLMEDPRTTIQARRVFGTPNPSATKQGTLQAALKQALGSQEQIVLEEQFMAGERSGRRMLNETNAVNPANQRKFQRAHAASMDGEWITLKSAGSPFALRGMASALNSLSALTIAMDLLLMNRDARIAQYEHAACVLTDEFGEFIVQSNADGIARSKLYVGGGLGGVREPLTEAEFAKLRREAAQECGTVDFWGNIVPGNRTHTPLYQVSPGDLGPGPI